MQADTACDHVIYFRFIRLTQISRSEISRSEQVATVNMVRAISQAEDLKHFRPTFSHCEQMI